MFGGRILSGLAAAALLGGSLSGSLGARVVYRGHPEDRADQHVIDWHLRKERLRIEENRRARQAREDALIAAKRERDAQWINAAEAKRARKRAKALRYAKTEGA